MTRALLTATLLVLFSGVSANAATLLQWDFNSVPPDANTGTGSLLPSVGSGIITAVGGASNPGFNSGVGSSDPAAADNSGYQTTDYAGQGSESGLRGIRVNASTVGFKNITGSFDLRTSNTSSRWYQVQYSIDGTTFNDLGSAVRLGLGDMSVGDTWSNSRSFDLSSISGVNNNPNFAFQIVSVFSPVAFTEFLSNTNFAAGTAYEAARNRSTGSQSNYAGGTWRFDMVGLNATAVPEPSSVAILCSIGTFVAYRRRKSRVATATS